MLHFIWYGCMTGFLLVSWYSDENLPYRSVSKVHDEWFADEEAARKSVGLLDKPVVQFSNIREVRTSYIIINVQLGWVMFGLFNLTHHYLLSVLHFFLILKQFTCGICFESFPCEKITSAACGHPFCLSCWSGASAIFWWSFSWYRCPIVECSWYLCSIIGCKLDILSFPYVYSFLFF